MYDGGSEITSYVVEQMNSEEREWNVISSKGEVRTTEFVASHLKPGVYYFFRVSAVNCVGTGRPIEIVQPVQAKDILGRNFVHSFSCICILKLRLGIYFLISFSFSSNRGS